MADTGSHSQIRLSLKGHVGLACGWMWDMAAVGPQLPHL